MTDTTHPATGDRDQTATPEKITEWANGGMAKQIAADLARKINGGTLHRYQELPSNPQLADEWDVSQRTISAAKKILGDHGILKLENRRYYVA
jgi:DNA-binding transcriptional MocR family regulator